MRKTLLVLCVLIPGIAVSAGEEPAATDGKALVRRICSGDASARYEAVCEALSMRVAVADALNAVVADAGQGLVSDMSKAGAIVVAGHLALLQCSEMLEREEDWQFKWKNPPMITSAYKTRGGLLDGHVARVALAVMGRADTVTVSRPALLIDISRYPALAVAIDDIRVGEATPVKRGIATLVDWYHGVCGELGGALDNLGIGNLSEEAAVTCAFLLGEFRAYDHGSLRDKIELEDAKGICYAYPATLSVSGADSLHPCVTALLKCGHRAGIRNCVDFLSHENASARARELVAGALVRIDREAAKTRFEEYKEKLTNGRDEDYGDRQGDLGRLESFESMIMQ